MEERKLKLNTKNTFFIGLAFFAILMLWQIYNTYCPLILREFLEAKYPENPDKLNYVIGIIMALDNVAALILMPIFGRLSDRTNTKIGKRMPFILIGMIASAIIFPLIAVFYLQNSLVGVIILMGFVLVIMQCYRSPAVALMPDVTPKPLRSKANGIINLVGYIGAIIGGALAIIFKKKDPTNTLELAYLWPFVISAVCMLIAMVILYIKVKEPKMLEETKDDVEYGEKLTQAIDDVDVDKPLTKRNIVNIIVILVAVFFWFMSFNAVETFNSLYCEKILGTSGIHGTFTIVLTVSSIIAFILCSGLADKIGRKWTVLLGILLLTIGFTIMSIFSYVLFENKDTLKIVLIGCSVILGVGWALININSYPMIVEMSNKNNIGRFTGYYYIASMAAQIATPILVGAIMSFNNEGLKLLYIYSAIVMGIAFLVFFFVKERRDLKKEKNTQNEKKSILERIGDADD